MDAVTPWEFDFFVPVPIVSTGAALLPSPDHKFEATVTAAGPPLNSAKVMSSRTSQQSSAPSSSVTLPASTARAVLVGRGLGPVLVSHETRSGVSNTVGVINQQATPIPLGSSPSGTSAKQTSQPDRDADAPLSSKLMGKQHPYIASRDVVCSLFLEWAPHRPGEVADDLDEMESEILTSERRSEIGGAPPGSFLGSDDSRSSAIQSAQSEHQALHRLRQQHARQYLHLGDISIPFTAIPLLDQAGDMANTQTVPTAGTLNTAPGTASSQTADSVHTTNGGNNSQVISPPLASSSVVQTAVAPIPSSAGGAVLPEVISTPLVRLLVVFGLVYQHVQCSIILHDLYRIPPCLHARLTLVLCTSDAGMKPAILTRQRWIRSR